MQMKLLVRTKGLSTDAARGLHYHKDVKLWYDVNLINHE